MTGTNARRGENPVYRYANLPRTSNVVPRPVRDASNTEGRPSNVRRRGETPAPGAPRGTGSERRSNVRKRLPDTAEFAAVARNLTENPQVTASDGSEGAANSAGTKAKRTFVDRPRFLVDLRRISRDARHALSVSSGLERDILGVVLHQLDVLGLSMEAGRS